MIIGLLSVVAAACSTTTTTPQATVTVTQPAVQSPTGTAAASPGAAGLETPVRDGALEFTVHGVRRANLVETAAKSNPQLPDGEFVIVSLTVRNIGTEPAQYFTDSQSLIVNGRQNPADILAAVYLDPQSADYIAPGLAVDIETPFDVPKGTVPDGVLLDEITEPSGVMVDLRGVPIAQS